MKLQDNKYSKKFAFLAQKPMELRIATKLQNWKIPFSSLQVKTEKTWTYSEECDYIAGIKKKKIFWAKQ